MKSPNVVEALLNKAGISVIGVLQSLPELTNLAETYATVATDLVDLADSGIASYMTGGDLANFAMNVFEMEGVLRQTTAPGGDLDILNLCDLNRSIGNTANSIKRLGKSIKGLLSTGIPANDPVPLQVGANALSSSANFLSDTIESIQGIGACAFRLACVLTGVTQSFLKFLSAFERLGLIEVRDALYAVYLAIVNGKLVLN